MWHICHLASVKSDNNLFDMKIDYKVYLVRLFVSFPKMLFLELCHLLLVYIMYIVSDLEWPKPVCAQITFKTI